MQVNNWALWLMLAWIALIIVFFVILLRRYTFGTWDAENPNPYQNETLGLPRGLMRSVLTLSILFVVLVLEVNSLNLKTEVVGNQTYVPEDRFDQLMTAFQMMIAFYFGSKVVHHVTAAEKSTRKKQIEVMARNNGLGDPEASG